MKNVFKILLSLLAVIAVIIGVNNLTSSIKRSNMYAKVEMDLEVGDLYFESHNYIKAAQVYEDILDHKFEVNALKGLAQSNYYLGKYSESLENAELLLSIEDDNLAYKTIKANALTGLRMFAESTEILNELNSDSSEVQVAYARLNLAKGEIEAAEANAKLAVEINPENEDAILALSDVYIYEEKYNLASNVLSQGYELTQSKVLLDRIDNIALTFEDK